MEKKLILKVLDKKQKIGNLHGTKEAEKMSLLELMAKVHEEDAEAVLATKDYIRKPNEANLMHLLYELIDGQMVRESVIRKYIPEKCECDNMRDDVYRANCNCYHYNDEYKPDTLNEVDDDVMYEVSHVWNGERVTDEVFDTKEEAQKAVMEYINSMEKHGVSMPYYINKFVLQSSEVVTSY